jgi:hypothetical protein
MNTTIPLQVTRRDIYGRAAYYPACDMTRLAAALAGTKTLSDAAIATLKRAGYTLQVVTDGPQTL